ncbi:beta-ketoacyl-ACP synthase 3 [Actinomadura rubrisoli]|uniref:Beta-ketoacyl-ACP synthase 3 n=1 Tax=Actinomadura rubrisoli TaxID=2530368 RepID=A0A4R5BBW9_9ACTN|nr:beta-ketoacyl-ACP synthase 3 [Actinomadura rubrisoli]TDD82679.1 beta-ketoacyl-ACP synthase 3 [Actinomadura rubrisoli]
MTAPAAVIAGLGACVPPRAVDNAVIAERLGVTPEWVRDRTGVVTRNLLDDRSTTRGLALEAGRRALRSAAASGDQGGDPDGSPARDPGGVLGADIDAVIVASWTQEQACPPMAPALASELGAGGAAAFDVGATCAGFVYALALAAGLIAAGTVRRVLVIAVETHSPYLDPDDRVTAPLFGDGAGSAVLRAGLPGEPGALVAFDLGSDGTGRDLLRVAPGGRGAEPCGDPFLRMAGSPVFLHAVRRMVSSSRAVLGSAGMTTADVDALVAHQANGRIMKTVASRLTIPPPRVVETIERFGNTGCASIPLALAVAGGAQAVRPGDRLLLTAFGAGFTWASAVLTWPDISVPEIGTQAPPARERKE